MARGDTIKFYNNDIFSVSEIMKDWKIEVNRLYKIDHHRNCAKDLAQHIDTNPNFDQTPQNILNSIHFINIERAKTSFKLNLHPHGTVSDLVYIPSAKELYATVTYDKPEWYSIFLKRYYRDISVYSLDYYGLNDPMLRLMASDNFAEHRKSVTRSIINSIKMEIDCSPDYALQIPRFSEISSFIPSRYDRAENIVIKSFEKSFSNKNKLSEFRNSKKGKKAIELEIIREMMVLQEIDASIF